MTAPHLTTLSSVFQEPPKAHPLHCLQLSVVAPDFLSVSPSHNYPPLTEFSSFESSAVTLSLWKFDEVMSDRNKNAQFLSRVSKLTRDIDIANLSVRLSVRPSVRNVPVSDENGSTYRHSFFHRMVAQSFCFYQHQHLHEIPTGSPPAGALNTGGV